METRKYAPDIGIAVPIFNRSWSNGPKRNNAIDAKSDRRVLEVGGKKISRKRGGIIKKHS